jgi:hypothetical protein
MDIESQQFVKRMNNYYLNVLYNIGFETDKLPFISRRYFLKALPKLVQNVGDWSF